mgnify:CR=1 FL=1
MVTTQRLPTSLTPLDTALAAVLRDVALVAPIELSPADALHCIAAEMPAYEAAPIGPMLGGAFCLPSVQEAVLNDLRIAHATFDEAAAGRHPALTA